MGIEECLLDRAKREGLKEGREEGREEGLKEGRVEGREEVLRETAFKMKKAGLHISLIADIAGLTVYEIKNT